MDKASEKSAFPEQLRATREKRGLSQAQLAELAGFQPSAISHFETEGRTPSFHNLKKLADALNVSIDDLLGRVADPSPAGPVAQKVFRDFGKMTQDDQASLANMAKFLADKNKPPAK